MARKSKLTRVAVELELQWAKRIAECKGCKSRIAS